MAKLTFIKSIILAAVVAAPISALACDAAGPSTHIGNITAVNASDKTFTIRDAQTQTLITFAANGEIMGNIKNAKGSVMVNYEESDDGDLQAVGVTF